MLAYGINFTMRIITTTGVIIIGIGILLYVARESISVHAVPTLQEYIASTTTFYTPKEYNQASVAWLASSTIVDSLLAPSTASSSKKVSNSIKTIKPENEKVPVIVNSIKTVPIDIETVKSQTKNSQASTKVSSTTTKTLAVVAVSSSTKSVSSLLPISTSKSTIYAFVAKTPSTREQGLSGYKTLDNDKGMLFIFPKPDKPDFWMKNMNFPLDLVWINSDRKIIGVSTNISPNTYPKSFAPPGKIQFVLEVNAGYAEKFGLITGTRVIF